ncbi:MAG: hypothetical protein M1281_17080 [Chloroflexi bacterium]|nr:hypothetical protein [Chloroflexota bacterium]
MKSGRLFLILGLVTILFAGSPLPVQAATPPPPQLGGPPVADWPLPAPELGLSAQSTPAWGQDIVLPQLKAVLVVGPIDGEQGVWTRDEIANMEIAAERLSAYGVTVYRFYTPDNDWEQIKAAANGAQFFLYRGHGIAWTGGPHPTVGGIALSGPIPNSMILYSSDDLRQDLRLAPNAIVMIYACYSAGSGGTELDLESSEAQRRVAEYSAPFIDLGAAGYFANWRPEAFPSFIDSLFQGKTLAETYAAFGDYNPATLERYDYPNHFGLAMWLGNYTDGNGTRYHYAFAGKLNVTLPDLYALKVSSVKNPVFLPAIFH